MKRYSDKDQNLAEIALLEQEIQRLEDSDMSECEYHTLEMLRNKLEEVKRR